MTSRTTTPMYISTEMKGMNGETASFPSSSGRLFELEIWPRRTAPCPPPPTLSSRKETDNRPGSPARIVIETQIEHWIRWTLESNIALAAALKRLRDSYKLLQEGMVEKDADEILAQVETAMKTVERSSM